MHQPVAVAAGRSALLEALDRLNDGRLRSYEADPGRLKEDFGIEETVLAGGYGYRQIFELVQNGADALLEARGGGELPEGEGRIHVQLRGRRLYVANTGAPLSEEGLDALLRSHSSPKRGNQIGRFGLGFKSLLKFDGRIDIFTRSSGAIRFDPHRCRDELRRKFGVPNVPALRLAWPLQPEERMKDRVCTELAWAETIVRVEIGSDDLIQRIRKEIRSFPAEFLLFFPVATKLTFDDGEDAAREIRLTIEGEQHILHDGEDVSRWRIAVREVCLTDPQAIEDATHIHARDRVPVCWAMPLEGRREEVGRFWAFFPTHTHTYLPGILNAPWKLNSDRNAIISGEWNAALMLEAASLIADALPSLATEDDPGRVLDAFPRQLDRRDDVASPLVEALWQRLTKAQTIPDGNGNLRSANELWRHPTDSWKLAAEWQELAGKHERSQLVHASCLARQRASRLNALAERIEPASAGQIAPALRRREADAWFAMVASIDPRAALRVLRLAEVFATDVKLHEWSKLRPTLAIVPTQSDKLVTAAHAILAPEGKRIPGRAIVAAELQSNPEGRRILKDVLKVKELNHEVWVSILEEALQEPAWSLEAREKKWKEFWSRLRRAPTEVRDEVFKRYRDRVHVRRRDGNWVKPDRVLLPGKLVRSSDRSPNSRVLVDPETHGQDRTSLDALGVAEIPSGDIGPGVFVEISGESGALEPWLEACRHCYRKKHDNSASWDYLQPDSFSMPRGYSLLDELTGAPKARFTALLLQRLEEPSFQHSIEFGHRTERRYPRIRVPHPLPWYVLHHGAVHLGSSTVPLKAFVARRNRPSLRSLPVWNDIESALDSLEKAFPEVSPTEADLCALWRAAIAALATPESIANDALTELWTGAAEDGVVPTELPARTGRVPLQAVFVTTSADLARRARSSSRVVVVLARPAILLWVQAGAQDLAGLIRPEWHATAGPPERLTNVVPELGEVLHPDVRDVARCQQVTQLRLRIEGELQDAPCLMHAGTLLLDQEQLRRLSRAERLRCLLAEIAASGWLQDSVEEALVLLGDAGVDERRAHVAAGTTLAERLLRAVGNRAEPLLHALGESLRDQPFVHECAPAQLADLVLRHLGPATLIALRETLEAEGLRPPKRWSTPEALAFVASLGFPPEFALSAEARREPEEWISGPIELPPLHDFQDEVYEGLRSLLASNTMRRRAVVSLPTGAGKTRVTVEAAVRLVLAPPGHSRSVLWIAQTDELCEQAVEAFRQVWINLGARRTDLRIVRLWGGTLNPTVQDPDKPVVVIASIQTLNSRLFQADLEWLRRPGLIVIDECHHAITPSYSALLRWLDIDAPQPRRYEPAIVGLSATPFRPDEEESRRLARRFNNLWLPADQERLYARLLEQRVLARTRYEALESGVDLTEEEFAKLQSLPGPWEGLDFENLLEAINQRLAGNASRNERLIQCIQKSAERSILFYANSVAHAEQMAARLNLAGVAAAAVSGNTPTVARRYFIERFQRGEIRVLCNHSVLTTGFDAPKTDMVLIARQVFSPVRYMQMVGRGLRGEKNGGTAWCRIVTVLDNLGRFADRHPFHYCQHYFSGLEAPGANP